MQSLHCVSARVSEGRADFELEISLAALLRPSHINIRIWRRIEEFVVANSLLNALLGAIGHSNGASGHRGRLTRRSQESLLRFARPRIRIVTTVQEVERGTTV